MKKWTSTKVCVWGGALEVKATKVTKKKSLLNPGILLLLLFIGRGQESGLIFTDIANVSLLSRNEQKILLDNFMSMLSQNE